MKEETYFWTLPFGARTETGNVANSPFFPGRHTYQLSTPDVNGELHWLIVKGVTGLLFPRLTNKETLIREFGVFQDGGDTVLLKIPVRNFSFSCDLIGSNRESYREVLLRATYVFSPHHCTASEPPNFDNTNEVFDIASRWGRPNPFTFTELLPNGVAYHTDCFVQTIEPQSTTESPDGFSISTSVRLSADSPFVYGNEEQVTLFGTYGAVNLGGSPVYFLDDLPPTPQTINYSFPSLASARSGFEMTMPLLLSQDRTLYSFGILETNTGNVSRFQYPDYPNAGWTLPAGSLDLIFDSQSRSFRAKYSSGTEFALDATVSQDSSWDDFEFVPGFSYRFFLELEEDFDPDGRPITSTLKYRPRWMGVG